MANPEHIEILNQGPDVWNAWKRVHPNPDLSDSFLQSYALSAVDFSGTNLRGADLSYSEFVNANFAYSDLRGANLTHTVFRVASFLGAQLGGAKLSHTIVALADLTDAKLDGADFSEAVLHGAVFGDNDLRGVKGLEHVKHNAPSTIGIDSIYKSQGHIPEAFLRGCGVPEDFIIYARSLTTKAIDFYSCFISYSSKDLEFAERLHADLQAKGVRVWFAPHDLPIGARIRPSIDESIRVYDKLLLVLSEASVSSQWVEQEVETALGREREQEGKTVLFPIRIDDAVMDSKAGWPALLKNTRNVGDFTCWKEHDSYQRAFDRLLRDLKAGA